MYISNFIIFIHKVVKFGKCNKIKHERCYKKLFGVLEDQFAWEVTIRLLDFDERDDFIHLLFSLLFVAATCFWFEQTFWSQ